MLHKHFKRARRHWNVIIEEPVSFASPGCDKVIAKWAREFAPHLIKEVERLRGELKIRNRKSRGLHADLAEENDNLDHVLGKLRDILGRLPADPAESVPAYFVTEQLGAILGEFREE
jgi:hypothetical protein